MSPIWRTNLIGALLIGLCALFVGLKLRVTTDIAEFLPSGEDQRQSALARSIAGSELSRSLLLSIAAKDAATAAQASKQLEQRFLTDTELMQHLAFVQGGPPQGIDETLWQFYQPRRFAFAAPNVEAARQLVSDAGLDNAVATLGEKLASPLSTLVSRVAPEDPLLSVPRLLESLAPNAPGLELVNERFIAEQRYALLVLGTRASAFDGAAQRVVLDRVQQHFSELRAQSNEELTLEQAGFGRFAVRAQETIQSDLQRISVLSVLGMLAVCITLFRSLRLVLMPWLPIGCGMLAGTAACLLFFGSVHGVTLAIGSSLIGVCIDYITHFYVHHLLSKDGSSAQETMRRVWMGLLLGGLTTVTGFALLAGSSFPGLGQIAAFSSVGIFAALISTRFLIPQLMPHKVVAPALLRRLADQFNDVIERLQRSRLALYVLPAAAVALSVAGAFSLRWDDDMSQLSHFAPALEAEDMRVRQRLGQVDQSRFIVALGADDESALRSNDQLQAQLNAAREAGELGSFQSASPLVTSAEQQESISQLLRAANLRERLGSRLSTAGYNIELFEPFFKALEAPAPPALRYADLAASNVAPLVRQFRIQLDGQVGFVTFLRQVNKPAALAQRLSPFDGVIYLDQSALMKSATSQYNRRVALLLGVGLIAVFGILLWRYRRVSVALATLLPAVLAGGVTIFVLNLQGIALDVLGLTGLLMVLSMGVDYSVFMAEAAGHGGSEDDGGEMGATLLGVIVDWFTTVFGFGVLAISNYPAMRIIGIVAGVGITAALILAPTTLALVHSPRAAKQPAQP